MSLCGFFISVCKFCILSIFRSILNWNQSNTFDPNNSQFKHTTLQTNEEILIPEIDRIVHHLQDHLIPFDLLPGVGLLVVNHPGRLHFVIRHHPATNARILVLQDSKCIKGFPHSFVNQLFRQPCFERGHPWWYPPCMHARLLCMGCNRTDLFYLCASTSWHLMTSQFSTSQHTNLEMQMVVFSVALTLKYSLSREGVIHFMTLKLIMVSAQLAEIKLENTINQNMINFISFNLYHI